jgi:hypothetical protein
VKHVRNFFGHTHFKNCNINYHAFFSDSEDEFEFEKNHPLSKCLAHSLLLAVTRKYYLVNDLRRSVAKLPEDVLYSLMLTCKESEGSKSRVAFVRIVNAAPFPMMVLAFHWTLDD